MRCWLTGLFALLDCIWSLFPIQGCALMRTDQVRAAGGYADADWGDDWVLAVSLAFRGRVEVHDRLGRRYRDNPGSLWTPCEALRNRTASKEGDVITVIITEATSATFAAQTKTDKSDSATINKGRLL